MAESPAVPDKPGSVSTPDPNAVQLTLLLRRLAKGDQEAGSAAIQAIEGELRRIAARYLRKERPGPHAANDRARPDPLAIGSVIPIFEPHTFVDVPLAGFPATATKETAIVIEAGPNSRFSRSPRSEAQRETQESARGQQHGAGFGS